MKFFCTISRKVKPHCLLMPCPFTGPKMFCAGPKLRLHFVSLQKLLCRHKKQFYWMQIIFLSGTKCLWLPQYVSKFLVWHKKFGPAQNILGSVKGQGIISMYCIPIYISHFQLQRVFWKWQKDELWLRSRNGWLDLWFLAVCFFALAISLCSSVTQLRCCT